MKLLPVPRSTSCATDGALTHPSARPLRHTKGD